MQAYTPTCSSSFNLQRLRLLWLVGIGLVMSFIIADLMVIPEAVYQVYFISRVGMQLPILSVGFALTYLPFYTKFHQQVCWLGILLISYANYWLIAQCWKITEFSFPYEGNLLYGA